MDEIVALRAIFGEDGDLLGPAADAAARDALEDVVGLFRFDLRVRPELGEGEDDADARARLVVSRRDDDDDDDGGGGVEIVSLPPVTLSVILPSDYPSVSPPAFALSASWLSRAALTRAADALDDVCARNAGDVIAFELAAWLKDESAREVFCVDGRLRLRASDGWAGEADDGDGGGDGDGDDGGGGGGATASADAAGSPPPPRGIPTSRGVDDAALAIMRHDATERARRFARAVVRCDVCFDDVAGSDTARVAPGACAHFFCASCVATIARTHVVEGSIASLVCPACGASIPPHVLRRFLSDELYERYETIALERSLAAMPDASRCPRCERVVIEDGDDHCGRCLGCEYTFCGLCRESWHPGESCLTPERKLEVLRSRGGSGAMAALGEDARRKTPRATRGRHGASVRRERRPTLPELRVRRREIRGLQQDDVRELRDALLLQVRRRRGRIRALQRRREVRVVRPRRRRGVGTRDERRASERGGTAEGRVRRRGRDRGVELPVVSTDVLQAREQQPHSVLVVRTAVLSPLQEDGAKGRGDGGALRSGCWEVQAALRGLIGATAG